MEVTTNQVIYKFSAQNTPVLEVASGLAGQNTYAGLFLKPAQES